MVENIACMRTIVRFIADNVNVIVEDNGFYLGEVDLAQIIDGARKEDDIDYKTNVIIFNFLTCCKNGYLVSNIHNLDLSKRTLFTDCKVTDVTPSGLKFIERAAK